MHGSTGVHTIVDKLIVCNGLTSVHGHAQIGWAEREEDQAEEGSDAGEICGDFRVQPAIPQQFGKWASQPNSCHPL